MIDGSEVSFGDDLLIERSEAGGIKLLPVVDSDLPGDAEAAHNVLPKELDDIGGGDGGDWLVPLVGDLDRDGGPFDHEVGQHLILDGAVCHE